MGKNRLNQLKSPIEKTDNPDLHDILSELVPFRISEVVIQKNNSSRVSIFSDGNFVFGMSLYDATTLSLHKGTEITARQVESICATVLRDQIKSWVLSLLARRPYSRFQLIRKARTKQYQRSDIDLILDDFESKGWLNDHEFAKAYANDKYNLSGWGPNKIKMYLFREGISQQIIDQVLANMENDSDIFSILEKLVQKKKNHFLRENDTFKRKKKVVDYLMRKGFNGNDVFKFIDRLITKLNS